MHVKNVIASKLYHNGTHVVCLTKLHIAMKKPTMKHYERENQQNKLIRKLNVLPIKKDTKLNHTFIDITCITY